MNTANHLGFEPYFLDANPPFGLGLIMFSQAAMELKGALLRSHSVML